MANQSPPQPKPPEIRRDWHRLFGLLLTGHLEGSPFSVDLEKDLSMKQQFLDVIIVLPKFPANQKLKADIVYNYPLKPPIRKGDPVAKLRVTSSSNAVNEIQLFAGEDVEPSSLMRRGLDTLAHQALRFIP